MKTGENIKKYILDASVVLTLLLPDENRLPQAKKYLQLIMDDSNQCWSVPFLEIEVANAIRSGVIQNRINKKDAPILLSKFKDIPIHYEDVEIDRAFELALSKQLSVYDALYVVLAQQKQAELLTMDKKLATVAQKLIS